MEEGKGVGVVGGEISPPTTPTPFSLLHALYDNLQTHLMMAHTEGRNM